MITSRDQLERVITEGWYGGARWLWLLLPLAGLFALLSAARRYYWRRRGSAVLPVPVVVVGGITVGGTGKTPVIISLALALKAAGVNVAIVSRGYGGQVGDVAMPVTPQSLPSEVGDEPCLIAQRTDCPVFVCRDRSKAVRAAADNGAQLVLSDDGLQHYAMHRDWEIIVLDGMRGTGNGWLLPAGPLREGRWRLSTANGVLERNGQQADTRFFYRPVAVKHLASEQRMELPTALLHWGATRAVAKPVAALTGLGQPEQFFTLLEQEGFLIERHTVGDHRALDPALLAQINTEVVLMTEKDAVKLSAPFDERLWCLEIDAVLPEVLLHSVINQFGRSEL